MATIYRSGISRGLVTVIALVLLPVYALMIYLSVWIGLALLVILTALIVDTLVNTRYTIDHKTLRVQSGLFDKRQFDIDRITEIARTTSLESAPTASACVWTNAKRSSSRPGNNRPSSTTCCASIPASSSSHRYRHRSNKYRG